MGYNLPPGCSLSDIPGNRPEDIAWERACEQASEELGYECTCAKWPSTELCEFCCEVERRAHELLEARYDV